MKDEAMLYSTVEVREAWRNTERDLLDTHPTSFLTLIVTRHGDTCINAAMFWSFFTGCLINREHEYFDYSNGYEVIGCLLINNRGYPEPLQMVEDDNFRWTGEII